MKKEKQKCVSCKHFNNAQRELNYWQGTGFCTNDKFRFNTYDGRLIGVYDKENKKDISKITGNPSHDFETVCKSPISVKESRYLLQVSCDFGCIYHENT